MQSTIQRQSLCKEKTSRSLGTRRDFEKLKTPSNSELEFEAGMGEWSCESESEPDEKHQIKSHMANKPEI
jgi:hypothetical protein